jgi:hypothetical protein
VDSGFCDNVLITGSCNILQALKDAPVFQISAGSPLYNTF